MYLKILNLLSFSFMLLSNYFIIDVFDNKPISNISKTYNTNLAPPNWAFSIWGLIYLYLFIFCIAQFIPSLKLNNFVNNIGIWFIMSNILNSLWIYIFTIGNPVAIAMSLGIITLLLIVLLICQSKGKFFSKDSTLSEILLGNIPFSIYLGWIITATILNLFTTLKAFEFDYIDSNLMYISGILFVALIYFLNLYKKNNYVTLVVFIYVLISLYIKHGNNKTLTLYNITITIALFILVLCKIIIDIIIKNK